MGHIAHLRNQFKSMSTIKRIRYYIFFYKIGPVVQEGIFKCKKMGPFNLNNLNSFYPGMLFAMFGRNWPTGSEEDDL